MNKECQFNFFHSSFAIDVSDYSNPVTPFLISSYFDFTPDSLNSVNYYFSLTNFETDKNILLNNPKTQFLLGKSKEENFRIYKGLDRNNNKYAMKKIIAHDIDEVEDFITEFELSLALCHPVNAQIPFSFNILYVLISIPYSI